MSFVLISGDGTTAPIPTRDAALDSLRDHLGYAFRERDAEVFHAALDAGDIYRFFHHPAESRPILAAVAPNPDAASPHTFANAHLQPGRSTTLLDTIRTAWAAREGDTPRVGDAYQPDNAPITRFTYTTDTKSQVGGMRGSYHISRNGYADYSGSLDPFVDHAAIMPTKTVLLQPFWFFLDGQVGAHRGVTVQIPVRLWGPRP